MGHGSSFPTKPEATLIGFQLSDLNTEAQELLISGGFGDVVKIPFKSGIDVLAVKIMNAKSKNELEIIKKEIGFLEKISNQPFKPRCFPQYYGYFQENKRGDNLDYNICFKWHPNTLRSYLRERHNSNQPMDPPRVLSFSTTLINGLAFLQLLEICHRDLKPETFYWMQVKRTLL